MVSSPLRNVATPAVGCSSDGGCRRRWCRQRFGDREGDGRRLVLGRL